MSARLIGDLAFDPSALSSRSPDLEAPDAGTGALWARLMVAWSETDGDGNVGALSSSSNGIVLGTDRQLDETWRFGALVGYSSTSFEAEAEQASGTSDALQVGLYGSAEADGLSLRAGDGYTAGAKAWQQAIAGAMAAGDFLTFARRPENRELRRAIEKWGYLERPQTPWLRVAPKFHPRKMVLDSE